MTQTHTIETIESTEYTTANYKNGLIAGIPIGLGYLFVSFTFGMTAILAGLTPYEALLMSASNCTSAGQLAGVNLLVGQSNYLELLVTVSIINSRYFLMSTSLSQKLHPSMTFLKRLIISFGMTDEVFAVNSVEVKDVTFSFFMGVFTFPFIGWSLGTLSGALVDNLMNEPMQHAASIAMYCMFIALVLPPSKHHKDIRFVVVLTLIFRVLFATLPFLNQISEGYTIILCGIFASLIGSFRYQEEKLT